MQNRLIIIKGYAFFYLLLILFACKNSNDAKSAGKEPPYRMFTVENVKTPGTWGYIVECNHHLLIQQFTIPALQGEQVFKSKADAEKVGELVTLKLNQSLRPSVTTKELAALGIIKATTDEKKK